ncbi:MAG TPA: hypothetical protein VN132_00710, partial [Bdellovibrio sp.]|nr:hypothetical protein [Bdellovibrio sp.]
SINKVCALAPSNDFIEGFSSATNFKVASHRIANTSSSSELTKWAESSQCSVLILAVTGLKTARLLRSLSSEIKAKTVVVNLGAPGLLKIETPYKKVLQLYFNHKDSGRKVAEHLHEILGIENPNVATR